MTRAVLVSSLLLLVAMTAGLASGGGSSQTAPTNTDDDPVIVIWRETARGETCGFSRAVWADGTMLMNVTGKYDGKNLVLATVDPKEVAAALAAIKAAGFFTTTPGPGVPDAPDAMLRVRTDGKDVTLHWHEYLMPGFGADLNTDKDYRAFVATWLKTRAAIHALAPLTLNRLDGKALRGFDPAKPNETPWMPK